MIAKKSQLSVMAVAVLAIVAVVAVALFAAGGARAENVTTNALPYESGNGQPPQQTTPEPTPQTQPEACSTDPAHAKTGGAFALFDVYWDADDQNLAINPCPPAVDHIVVRRRPTSPPIVVGTSRTASDINIGSTIIHMPSDFRLEVVEKNGPRDGEDGTYAVAKTSRLYQAYSADDPNKFVWLLPEWGPETPDEEELFHIGFSAGLLRPADWEGNIRWNFELVRQPGIAPADRGVVLVTEDPTFQNIDWDSRHPDEQLVDVPPGQYEHRSWAFTEPGTYVLRVHARGTRADIPDKTESSDIGHYTFHVGSLADLNVAVSADNEAPEAGGVVTYTVNAANAGPDTAPHGEVTVSLPEGLTYNPVDTLVNTAAPADGAVTLSDDGRTLTWEVGQMAKDYSSTLSFKANVGADTADQTLQVTANIVAREEIGSSTVAQLDPRDRDDSSTATVTPTGTPNGAPLFNLQWSVEENAMAGTVVGRIKVVDPESDPLEYDFASDGRENFVAVRTADGVEVRVSALARLDHEAGPQSYNLVLAVTDNKGPAGNPDPTTDHTIGLMITVTDVVDEASDLAFSVDPTEQVIGGTVTFTLDTLAPLPEGASEDTVHITGPNPGESHTVNNATFPVTWELTGSPPPGSWEYNASLSFDLKDGKRVRYSADSITVTWSDTPADSGTGDTGSDTGGNNQ